MRSRQLRLLLVGPGRAGGSLARILMAYGIACPGGTIDRGTPPPPPREWDLAIFGTPDGAIHEAARALASASPPGRPFAGRIALHLSGAVPASALEALRARGAAVAAMHPMAAFPTPRTPASRLRGAFFGIQGDPEACRLAERIARRLGARPLRLDAGGKVLTHAATVLASNGMVALLSEAEELLVLAGVAREDARALLLPLVAGTLENTRRAGPGGALTGPFARGDEETIARERKALRAARPAAAGLYDAAGRVLRDLARVQAAGDPRRGRRG